MAKAETTPLNKSCKTHQPSLGGFGRDQKLLATVVFDHRSLGVEKFIVQMSPIVRACVEEHVLHTPGHRRASCVGQCFG